MKFFNFVYAINKFQIFFLFVLLSCFFTIIINTFIVDDQVYYHSFGEQMSIDRIDKMLQLKNEWEWLGYIAIPIFLLIKYSSVGTCLMIGVFFSGWDLSFKKAFQIAMIADIALLLGQLVKVISLFFINLKTLNEIQTFMPLSILSLFDLKSIQPWFLYPFQQINIFEILYWLLLGLLLKVEIKKSYEFSLKIVVASYGSGLLIWIIFLMFLSVNFS